MTTADVCGTGDASGTTPESYRGRTDNAVPVAGSEGRGSEGGGLEPRAGAPTSRGDGGVQDFHQRLGRVLAEIAPNCGVAETEAVVNAAAAAAAAGDDFPEGIVTGLAGAISDVARDAATETAGETPMRFPAQASRPVSWRGFGALIPVLAGSPGAGASSLAAAATDALQDAGLCALLVDADDPARSGLACAAAEDGPWVRRIGEHVRIRYSWRDDALVARLETSLPTVTPGMMPAPPSWLPDPAPQPLHATVVDVGHGGWRAAADPLYGAGGWLRAGTPPQRPLLVVRATRPSLRQAEQLLARLEPWVERGAATAPYQLLVNGVRRWPSGVVGATGPRLERLVDNALFVPHDDGWELGGVSDEPSPRRAVAALSLLFERWGVLGHGDRR